MSTKGAEWMFEEDFSHRLSELRVKRGVSARDMSLYIGQNPGYINSIENGNSMPSMSVFLSICDYLEITPKEFFDVDAKAPEKLRHITEDLKKLDDEQLSSIETIIKGLSKKNR